MEYQNQKIFFQFNSQILITKYLKEYSLWYINLKIILITLFICIASISFAQDLSLSVGADVVSRYIWRGLNVNDAFNIQPSIISYLFLVLALDYGVHTLFLLIQIIIHIVRKLILTLDTTMLLKME